MRFRYVLALLLLIPLTDALLLVVVADFLGWQATVVLVVLTGLVGMLLVRAEGRHTLRRIQQQVARGESPTNELLDGALLIAAGAFLLTPGVVTDTLGFLLAIPLTRYPIRTVIKKYVVLPKLEERTGGFVTGNVWTAGFPNGDGFSNGDSRFTGGGGGFPGSGSADGTDGVSDFDADSDDVYHLGPEDFEGDDDSDADGHDNR